MKNLRGAPNSFQTTEQKKCAVNHKIWISSFLLSGCWLSHWLNTVQQGWGQATSEVSITLILAPTKLRSPRHMKLFQNYFSRYVRIGKGLQEPPPRSSIGVETVDGKRLFSRVSVGSIVFKLGYRQGRNNHWVEWHVSSK